MSIKGKGVLGGVAALGVGVVMLGGIVPAAYGQDDGGKSVTQIKKVIKAVLPEKAVATVSKTKVEHTSPSSNLLSILKNIPGFNVMSVGPGNLLSGDTAFTLNGFSSSQVGSTFDGVPIINTFLGGVYGQGDDHAVTPMTTGQISGVQVYSGANTPQQNSLNSLGGTINFSPKMPSLKSGVDVGLSGGSYARQGGNNSVSMQANSGAIKSLDGFRLLARYGHTNETGFQRQVYAHLNSYYLAAIQPFNEGLSKLSLIVIHNDEKARMPDLIPLALINQYGRDYQYPKGVVDNIVRSHTTHIILGIKSLLNPVAVGGFKFFYNNTQNDRTAYANAAYNNSYMGYGLPTTLKSSSALDGYGSNFNVYNNNLATQMFGSAHAGTQYQRYIDNYHNIGSKAHITLLLPSNTVTFGSMVLQAKDYSTEGWYGASPVPMIMGYNNAWLEHDGKDYWDAYIQDDMSLMNGRLHIYPGVKYVHVSMFSSDAQGYYYSYGGAVSKTFTWAEPSLGATFSPIKPVEVYANYGRTYKAPNISALYSVIGSSPIPSPVTVVPEYVDSIDAGIRYSSRFGKASVSVFDRLFNQVFSYSYSNVTGVTTEYNSGTAAYKGFTVAVEKPLFAHLSIEGNYGYTDAKYTKNFTGNNGTVTAGMWRPDVPEYTANLGLSYHHSGWYASLSSHFVGRQYIAYNGGTTSGVTISSYSVTDLTAAYTWEPHGDYVKKIKFSAYLDNIADTQYIAYADVHGSQGASGNYERVQEGAPRFIGVAVNASF
ncbi:hypothetical protein BI364_04590 [Acidihalobacter yilgarnensis]|uniref:TonB-dependent receptor n=1 Tax=Acidihalobacter yilgarnensis TaxID=2819280 RepID=A0A1D8ILP1_9GAMM|nr:TonB-dependent receptor [Acidihalobacter yilgarnensis]AOU97364.1 hypothetical protein BI364_04590 [Acidihalobacter yilgarnensis]